MSSEQSQQYKAHMQQVARLKEAQANAEAAAKRRRWVQTVTSDDVDAGRANPAADVKVYYCAHCGQFSFMCNVDLASLPVRARDGATVVAENKYKVRRFTKAERPRLLQREGDQVERQFRFHCKECDLPLLYRTVSEADPAPQPPATAAAAAAAAGTAPSASSAVGGETAGSGGAFCNTYVLPGALVTDPHQVKARLTALQRDREEEQAEAAVEAEARAAHPR